MTAPSHLQRQTEAMWRAVAEARRGQTEAYLLLDGLARWNCPSERRPFLEIRCFPLLIAGEPRAFKAALPQRAY